MGACISNNSKESSSTPGTIKNIKVVHYNGYLENFEDPITAGEVTANVPKHFLCTPTQLILQDLKPLRPEIKLESGHIYFLLPYSALQFEVSAVDLASISKKLTTVAKTGISLSKSPSGNSEGGYLMSPSASPSPYRSGSIRNSPGQSPNWYPNSYSGSPVGPSPASPYRTKQSPRRSAKSKKPNRYSNLYAVASGPSPDEVESSPIRSAPPRSPHQYSDRYVITGEGPPRSPLRNVITGDDTVSDLQMSAKSPAWKPMLSTIRERSITRRSESDLQEKNVQIPILE